MSYGRQAPKTFQNASKPQDYVPGLGRGAVGFTTRSDIGPALSAGRGRGAGRVNAQFGQAPIGYVAGAGRGAGGFGETKPSADSVNKDGASYSETNFDKFGGYSESLFNQGAYDDADRDADRVWAAIDERMNERGKRRRKTPDSAQGDETQQSKQRITDQFSDLKEKLKGVSYEEWDGIPEANTGIRAHKHREEMSAPVSDSIILGQFNNSGSSSSSSSSTGVTGGSSLTIQRGRMIRDELDKGAAPAALESGAAAGTMDVDGYLSNLESVGATAATSQIGDIKKARTLLKSVTNSNPAHGPGWIAAARLEEVAGQISEARKIIRNGCSQCPTNEDVWIEAARLNTPVNAKVILGRAIEHLPTSVRVWLAAAALETDDTGRKKRVLRRALEHVPNSEKLWKALISAEEDEADAHIMMARAVECVPRSVDLWLALARMEDYEQAQVVLNKARKQNPSEPKIWIAACALEETQAADTGATEEQLASKLDVVLGKAVKSLSGGGGGGKETVVVSREDWLVLAKTMENGGSLHTCRAIVRATLALGLEEADLRRTWAKDAQACADSHHVETARALHMGCIERYPGDKRALLSACAFEGTHGNKDTLVRLLQRAVSLCPQAEVFWLMAAKETWVTAGDVAGARDFLSRAFQAGHNSERVWLAAAKLEWETGEVERARAVLQKARQTSPSARVFMKSALLERQQLPPPTDATREQVEPVRTLLKVACEKFPDFYKLWVMAGQLELTYGGGNTARAREIFLQGLKHCPTSEVLWTLAARLEEQHVSVAKARSVLEMARLKNPSSAAIWLQVVQLERRHGNEEMANSQMAKALQECPKSGALWAENVRAASKNEQRARSADALQHCENDAQVLTAVATVFARDAKKKAARKWFEKAMAADPTFVDSVVEWVQFEAKHGSPETISLIEEKFALAVKNAQTLKGSKWLAVAKLDENFGKTPLDILKTFHHS